MGSDEGVGFFGQAFVSYRIDEDVEGFPVGARRAAGRPMAILKRHTESVEALA